MSDERHEDAAPDPIRPASDPVAALRLRPARPRVTRLSRKVLTGGAAIALVAVSGAVFWALQNNRHRNAAPEELYSTDHRTTADGLAGLPRDYTGIPRQAPPLGPPLPGDLGRPMLNADAAPNTAIPAGPAVDPEAQRRAQEIEAARISRLFASTNIRERPRSRRHPRREQRQMPAPRRVRPRSHRPTLPLPRTCRTASSPSSTLRSIAERSVPIGWQSPASPYVVQAGTVIPAR